MAVKQIESHKLRVVIFDLDDTLRASYPHPNKAFADFVSTQDVELDEDARLNAYRWSHGYWASSTTLLDDYHKHQGYEEPFWQNYTRRHLEALGLNGEQVDHISPVVHAFMRDDYKPESRLVPQCLEILDGLRRTGFMVGLLTNRTRPIYKEMLELGLDHHLDFFLTGGQLEAFKPAPEIFAKTLDLIGFSPAETLYVGDNFFADIIGAQKADIQAVLIDPLGLYPEADCPSIRALTEISELLGIGALSH